MLLFRLVMRSCSVERDTRRFPVSKSMHIIISLLLSFIEHLFKELFMLILLLNKIIEKWELRHFQEPNPQICFIYYSVSTKISSICRWCLGLIYIQNDWNFHFDQKKLFVIDFQFSSSLFLYIHHEAVGHSIVGRINAQWIANDNN